MTKNISTEVNVHNQMSKDIAKKPKKKSPKTKENKGWGEGNIKGHPGWA